MPARKREHPAHGASGGAGVEGSVSHARRLDRGTSAVMRDIQQAKEDSAFGVVLSFSCLPKISESGIWVTNPVYAMKDGLGGDAVRRS